MSWTICTLNDICDKANGHIQTGPFGSQLHQSDYSKTGTPVVMPKDIVNGTISEENIARISDEHVLHLSRHQVKTGDILFSRRGDVGRCAYISKKEQGWLCGTGCLRVTVDTEIADSKFIFYYLQQPSSIGWIEKHAIGATMLNLNTGILANVPIMLPSLPAQRRIASILSAYDDLIENNQKQIKLLEEAAQRLYKEWFVDLRFPGWENTKIVDGVPEGWERATVGSLLRKISRTKQILACDYQIDGTIPIIDQSRDFIAGYTNNTEARIELNEPIIVFGDHTRILKYITFPFAKGADGTQLIISSSDRMPQSLFYFSLIHVDLSNYHYARHFKYLKESVVLVPTRIIAQSFDSIVQSIMSRIQVLRDNSFKAIKVRNQLIPKLMSKETEV